MLIVISYDIPNDTTRLRVHKELLNWGYPVQKSVFEAHLTDTQVSRMTERLTKLINPQEDSIRVYRLCARCEGQCEYLGLAEPTPDPDFWIV